MKTLNKQLDQIETTLFGQTTPRTHRRSLVTEKAQLLLIIAMSLLFTSAFIYSTVHYSTTIERINNHAEVTDLRAKGLMARVSSTTNCSSTEPLCWTESSYDVSSWQQVNPTRMTPGDLRSIHANHIYYVIDVPVAQRDTPMSYTPSYVHHRKFDVYVDGQLQAQGGSDYSDYSPMVVPVRSKSGISRVAIAATLSPGDRGIVSIGGIHVVGPTKIVREMQVADERISFTYFLLFLISKGSIFLIFALFYFFSDSRRNLFYFLIYAFASAVEGFFLGDFLASHISTYARVALFRWTTMVGSSALLMFFIDYFLARNLREKALRYNRLVILGYTILCGVYFFSQGSVVTAKHSRMIYEIYSYAVLAVGFSLGCLASRFFWRNKIATRYSRSVLMFSAVILGYIALITWERYFNEAKGFDKRAIFDLIFFYFIASRTASDSGFNEKRIVNLEGHMVEKKRMEEELQEAASINQAFLPHHIPQREDLKIDVFHKSLTESGGDWYAVEATERFTHVLLSDITGHGVQASIVAATCKTVLSQFKLLEGESLNQADFLAKYSHRLNQILFDHGRGRHVATFLGLSFDHEKRTLYHVTGGHPASVLLSGGDHPVLRPLQSRHSALGIHAELNYVIQSVPITSSSDLVCFTDGLPFQQNLRLFKPKLEAMHRSATWQHPARELQVFMSEEKNLKMASSDDLTIIWLRFG